MKRFNWITVADEQIELYAQNGCEASLLYEAIAYAEDGDEDAAASLAADFQP